MSKCAGTDYKGNSCRAYSINDTRFCKNHQHMCDYTDEMIQQMTLCSGCKKLYYLPESKTCEKCKERTVKYNKDVSEKRSAIERCGKPECKNKRSEENAYCGIHQLCLFEDECKAENVRPCYQYKKGCRAKLDETYTFSSCQDCLQKAREKDHARRSGVVQTVVNNTKQCSTCCKTKPLSEFVNNNNSNELKTCIACREDNKKQDYKRNREHVNALSRVNSQKPERKAVKQEWKENNYDKVAEYWINARSRQINEDHEAYLQKQAANMKQWRDNNPDKVEEINRKNRNSIERNYYSYKKRAEDKRLAFELSINEFKNIVSNECYYCNKNTDKNFIGIDRIDSHNGYITSNCVSCCELCNFMKGTLHIGVFLRRIEHILKHNNKIEEGNYYENVFCNHISASYQSYKNRANKKNIVFDLTNDEYMELIAKNCYLCGKQSIDNHRNGIDRIDSKQGYVLCNVKTACCECNLMKNNIELDNFFNKLLEIYNNFKFKKLSYPDIPENANYKLINPNKNKKTKEELCEERKMLREQRKQNQKEKYTDKDNIKLIAKSIADKRRNK
jgi:hypothetical protein